jgi:hypothetical protein
VFTVREAVEGRNVRGLLQGKARAARGEHAVTVEVARTGFRLAARREGSVLIRLDRTGQRLLARFYELPTEVSTSGLPRNLRVRFLYHRIRATLRDYAKWTCPSEVCFTTFKEFRLSGLPKASTITLQCQGADCPFSRRRAALKTSEANLASMLVDTRFAPTSVLDVRIAAPSSIAEVTRFTFVARGLPHYLVLCQPPGEPAPGACR